MKHKVSELEGALLDEAVAKAIGYIWRAPERGNPIGGWWDRWPGRNPIAKLEYQPSGDWSYGGPIIECEGISLCRSADGSVWYALARDRVGYRLGPTPLIAAMRCFVANRFGEEVELP